MPVISSISGCGCVHTGGGGPGGEGENESQFEVSHHPQEGKGGGSSGMVNPADYGPAPDPGRTADS